MKKYILALMFASSIAHAEQWLEMPNNAGGKILLLSGKCKAGEKGNMVIATTPKGDNINGCWYYFADMIHISWENGKTSSFEPNDFSVRESK